MLEEVRARTHELDVVHLHTEHVHLPLFRPLARKTVTTMHWRLDLPELAPLYRTFADMPLVSISHAQRKPLPFANWVGMVHHGLAREVCPFNPSPRGGYFAFLGRVSPEKGLAQAVEIARRAGARLRIAAKVDEADKPAFLGNATALLFPVDWPEPFGLAMIEAMSCGTPVVAFPRGAVREIVEPGITGFIVDSPQAAVEAMARARDLDRSRVRSRFEERFSAARMAQDYLAVYRARGRRRAVAAA